MTTVGLHESLQFEIYLYIWISKGYGNNIHRIRNEKQQEMKRKQEGEFSPSRINKKRQVMT